MPGLAIHRSRKLIPPFALHRPDNIAEACALLARHGRDAAMLAGGIDVISRAKSGAGAAYLISLRQIPALRGVACAEGRLEIGAATTHREVETDVLVLRHLPALAAYVAGLGNIRIRVQGTIGGNVMAGEPGYEMLPLLMALDATLHFAEAGDGADVMLAARDFAGRPGLLAKISLPLGPVAVAWDRSLRPGFGVVVALRGGERVVAGAAALGGAHRRPVWAKLRLPENGSREALLREGQSIAQEWSAQWPDPDLPNGVAAGYCRRTAPVLLRRALRDLAGRAA